MIKKESRNVMRERRHVRVRKNISGTASLPRLNVFRSNLVSSSSKVLKVNGGNIEGAKAVGKDIALKCKNAKIEKVVFDRGGYLYHGRVAALADAARENGLEI